MVLPDVVTQIWHPLTCIKDVDWDRLQQSHQRPSRSAGADSECSERGGLDTCPLASYIDNFYFSENSVKIIQNFKEKGAVTVPLDYP